MTFGFTDPKGMMADYSGDGAVTTLNNVVHTYHHTKVAALRRKMRLRAIAEARREARHRRWLARQHKIWLKHRKALLAAAIRKREAAEAKAASAARAAVAKRGFAGMIDPNWAKNTQVVDTKEQHYTDLNVQVPYVTGGRIDNFRVYDDGAVRVTRHYYLGVAYPPGLSASYMGYSGQTKSGLYGELGGGLVEGAAVGVSSRGSGTEVLSGKTSYLQVGLTSAAAGASTFVVFYPVDFDNYQPGTLTGGGGGIHPCDQGGD